MSLTWRQTLRGSYFRVETPDEVHPCELVLDLSLDRPAWHARQWQARADGRLSLDGLLEQAPVGGELLMRWWPPSTGRYDLRVGDMRLRAAFRPSPLRPVRSLTRFWGSLDEGEHTIALLHLHFDLRRDLAEMMQSLGRIATP